MSAFASLSGPRLRAAGFALALVLTPALAACGEAADTESAQPGAEESATTPAPSPSSTLPACGDVWVVGAKLPAAYAGCQDAGVAADDSTAPCSMGDTLIQHGSDLYASPGKQIRKAEGGFAADAAFQRVYATCTG